jgi:CRISPR/Cas system-associated exonuclease Cas4 (RecB family)
MDAGEAREVVTAWKVFRTVHEMLEDRVSPTAPPYMKICMSCSEGLTLGGHRATT